jgi:hypothetical protein
LVAERASNRGYLFTDDARKFDTAIVDANAELLGVAAGTVKSTASRALAKLRLAPDLIDTGVGGN